MGRLSTVVVLVMFLFSGLNASAGSRAELVIDSIRVLETPWQLELSGPLANPCLKNPKATLVNSKESEREFVLIVVAEKTAELCAQFVAGTYLTVIDVREALAKFRDQFSDGVVLTVVERGTSFEMSFYVDALPERRAHMIPITSRRGERHPGAGIRLPVVPVVLQ